MLDVPRVQVDFHLRIDPHSSARSVVARKWPGAHFLNDSRNLQHAGVCKMIS